MAKYAVKGNREIAVANETEEKALVKQGYDIVDGDGKLLTAGRGKTIPYEQHEGVKAENDKLKAENDKLKAENETLVENNKKLEAKIKELEKELKELKKA